VKWPTHPVAELFPLLTVTEAAEALGVSRATVYRWIADGLIPVIRWRGRTRIRRDALQQALAAAER